MCFFPGAGCSYADGTEDQCTEDAYSNGNVYDQNGLVEDVVESEARTDLEDGEGFSGPAWAGRWFAGTITCLNLTPQQRCEACWLFVYSSGQSTNSPTIGSEFAVLRGGESR